MNDAVRTGHAMLSRRLARSTTWTLVVMICFASVIIACGGTTEPTPTPTPPLILASPTPSAQPVPPTPPPPDTLIDGGDPLMEKEIVAAEHEGGALVEGWAADLQTVNPVLMNDTPTAAFAAMMFEPLVEIHPDRLEPIGVLAEAWEVSGDGRRWTFYLREGITWHDGEPFRALDVQFTFNLHLDPASGSSYTSDLASKIEKVEVLNALTVRFHLPTPFAGFAVDVATHPIVAEHIWRDVPTLEIASDPGSTGAEPERVIGTGPFRFVTWVPGERAVVERFDDYWGGRPALDEYIFKVIPDQAAGIAQLRTGEIDWLGGIPGSSIAELTDSPDVALHKSATLSFSFYGTNLDPAQTPLFQDVNVRQAMLYALDREAMVEAIRFGYAQVAIGTMPVLSWAYNPSGIERTYSYDPGRARTMLDDAGWNVGPDGIRVKDGQRLSFDMLSDAGDPEYVAMLTAMQQYWREVGIDMRPNLVPFHVLVETITVTRDFESFLIGFSWGVSPDQGVMFACSAYESGFNVVKYCNEEVDRILADARAEQNQVRRIALYSEFQNLLLADLPIAVIDFPESITGLNTRVHNVFPSSINERFNAETWWVEE